ncbi:thiamine phosphate synthase [Paenibacillus chartarius]|uniref:Thiamine-phosphate synthase n=1 Tax=Paenibacillus chartarius TaxID=747481 RepID=A0ABV6DPL2_9BACL
MAGELHVISTGRQPLERLADIAAAVAPYVTAIHLRERASTAAELLACIERMRKLGVAAERIIVNDRADVAGAAGVRGVQLAGHSIGAAAARRLFPQLRIGVSVHSEAEAIRAAVDGADYVLYGHIYETASKPGVASRGLEALRSVAEHVPQLPVLAIGGITPQRVPEVLAAGAQGVAVMSGVLEADDPLLAAKAYAEYLVTGRESHGASC